MRVVKGIRALFRFLLTAAVVMILLSAASLVLGSVSTALALLSLSCGLLSVAHYLASIEMDVLRMLLVASTISFVAEMVFCRGTPLENGVAFAGVLLCIASLAMLRSELGEG